MPLFVLRISGMFYVCFVRNVCAVNSQENEAAAFLSHRLHLSTLLSSSSTVRAQSIVFPPCNRKPFDFPATSSPSITPPRSGEQIARSFSIHHRWYSFSQSIANLPQSSAFWCLIEDLLLLFIAIAFRRLNSTILKSTIPL